MHSGLRRLRGTIGMGLTWALGWAVTGLLIGVTSVLLPNLPWWEGFFRVFDAPLPALAIPGFVAGAAFSVVLGIAGREKRFDELSLPGMTALGSVGGLAFGVAIAAIGFPAGAIVFLATLSAATAAATLLVARRGEQRELLEPGSDRVLPGNDS